MFQNISRVNHSCVPNSQGNFHDILGRFNIHATSDIEANEEITINYLLEIGAQRASRQQHLLHSYGFSCDCPACDLESARGRAGEKQRLEMQRRLKAFVEARDQSPELKLETTRSFIRLLEEDKIAGRELATLYVPSPITANPLRSLC